jgi:hypothetical protein
MPQQVTELGALLDQLGLGESGHFLLEAGDAHDFTQHQAGIIETERFVEVAGD